MGTNGSKKLTPYNSASYRISIQGSLPQSWYDRVNGMVVSTDHDSGQHPVTVLTGQLMDQAALFGVLSIVYMLILPLLSAEYTSSERASERG